MSESPGAATQAEWTAPSPQSPFGYRDFRLLWTGALLSFTGSWIQNIAQGWYVFELTGDTGKLALVSFLGMAPISVIGPFAGSLADMFDKRRVLVATQAIFALCALYLAAAIQFGFIQYWHILVVALISGTTGAIEMPTRQSVISRVVPPELLPKAIPLNAMTFNLARIVGPAIGAVLLAAIGPQACYLVNGLSYTALIVAALAIRTDLSAAERAPQPIMDLLFEGMLYTWRDKRLRTLFILETILATFGLIYLPLMPAIAKNALGLGEVGLGWAMTSVGVGAISGLVLMTRLSHLPWRATSVRLAMTVFGAAMAILAIARSPLLAFPVLALMGMTAIVHFNTTNTLFQVLSPEHLRGRVLAMHVWALAGIGPFGILAAGSLAQSTSLQFVLGAGAGLVLLGAGWGWLQGGAMQGVE